MPSDPAEILSLVLLQDLIILGLVIGFFWVGVFVARRLGHPVGYGLGALGLARPKSGTFAGVTIGLLVGSGAFLVSGVVGVLSAQMLERYGYSSENTAQEPLLSGVQQWVGESPEIAVPVAIAVMVIFAPAAEELVFRGAIFGGLSRLGLLISRRPGNEGVPRAVRRTSFVLAALLSSALFALLHLSPVILPAVFIMGIVLCVLYEKTGSLLSPFAAHAVFNFVPTLLMILLGLGVLEMPAI